MKPEERYRKRLSSMTHPRLTVDTIDIYVPLKLRLEFMQSKKDLLAGVVLDVGCGEKPYRDLILNSSRGVKSYIGLDISSDIYGHQDMVWDGRSIPMLDNSVEGCVCTEVLEHCPDPEVILCEMSRVLKPGGVLILTVPLVWPIHDAPNDYFRYTPYSLQRMMRQAGYSKTDIYMMGGWDIVLAVVLGVWAARRPMSRWKQRCARRLVMPLISALYRKSRIESNATLCNPIVIDDLPYVWRNQMTIGYGVIGVK